MRDLGIPKNSPIIQGFSGMHGLWCWQFCPYHPVKQLHVYSGEDSCKVQLPSPHTPMAQSETKVKIIELKLLVASNTGSKTIIRRHENKEGSRIYFSDPHYVSVGYNETPERNLSLETNILHYDMSKFEYTIICTINMTTELTVITCRSHSRNGGNGDLTRRPRPHTHHILRPLSQPAHHSTIPVHIHVTRGLMLMAVATGYYTLRFSRRHLVQ